MGIAALESCSTEETSVNDTAHAITQPISTSIQYGGDRLGRKSMNTALHHPRKAKPDKRDGPPGRQSSLNAPHMVCTHNSTARYPTLSITSTTSKMSQPESGPRIAPMSSLGPLKHQIHDSSTITSSHPLVLDEKKTHCTQPHSFTRDVQAERIPERQPHEKDVARRQRKSRLRWWMEFAVSCALGLATAALLKWKWDVPKTKCV
jgi:hypothetical protein